MGKMTQPETDKELEILLAKFQVALDFGKMLNQNPLEDVGEFIKLVAKSLPEVLDPEQLQHFFEETKEYKDHSEYWHVAGPFMSRLIQNSYRAGHNGFNFDSSDCGELYSMGNGLRGWNISNRLEITLSGVFYSPLSGVRNLDARLKGELRYSPGGKKSRNCLFDLTSAHVGCMIMPEENCIYKVDVVDKFIINGGKDIHFVFESCNRETLDKLFKKGTRASGFHATLKHGIIAYVDDKTYKQLNVEV